MHGMEEELKKLLEEMGAKLDHIGILSEDIAHTEKVLGRLPYLERFQSLGTTYYGRKVLSVGKPYTITISIAKFSDLDLKLEILQPERELTPDGCIYTEHLEKHGPGLHHFAYELPDEDTYNRVVNMFLKSGDEVILRGRIEPGTDAGLPNGIEFIYLQPSGDCGCYLELKTENLKN